jgi:hypothetical protein
LAIGGALVSLLLMGNLFFLKKLVQKVDLLDTRHAENANRTREAEE